MPFSEQGPSLADSFEYVMYGKVYRIDSDGESGRLWVSIIITSFTCNVWYSIVLYSIVCHEQYILVNQGDCELVFIITYL